MSKHIPFFNAGVITNPCRNFNCGLRLGMDELLQNILFVDVINYPCHELSSQNASRSGQNVAWSISWDRNDILDFLKASLSQTLLEMVIW